MASLIDTNVLVYLYDPRSPQKQEVAERILRKGVATGELALPHQTIVEFVAATTRRKGTSGRGARAAGAV